jgi:hypothetical protein
MKLLINIWILAISIFGIYFVSKLLTQLNLTLTAWGL